MLYAFLDRHNLESIGTKRNQGEYCMCEKMNEDWRMTNEDRKYFWDTLCILDGKNMQEDIARLAKVIKYPRFLFRYRSVNNKSLTALSENKLYFSSANYYDDPFDTYLRIDHDEVCNGIEMAWQRKNSNGQEFMNFAKRMGVSEECINEILSNVNLNFIQKFSYEYLKTMRSQIRKEIYSVCFSDTWKNENLWLKYADQHKGFTVVYDIEDNSRFMCGKESICEQCMMKDIPMPLYPVYYSDVKYDATVYARDFATYKLLQYFNNQQVNELLNSFSPRPWESEKISLIKKKCHEYDREWRSILSIPYQEGKIFSKKWKPYGVILGLNIEETEKKLVLLAAKEACIENVFAVKIADDDELGIIQI